MMPWSLRERGDIGGWWRLAAAADGYHTPVVGRVADPSSPTKPWRCPDPEINGEEDGP